MGDINTKEYDTNISLHVRSQEELNADEAAVIYKNLQDGFSVTTPQMHFKNTAVEGFIEDLNREICTLKKYNYSAQKNNVVSRYYGEEIRLYVYGNSKEVLVNVYTRTEDINNSVWKLYSKNSPKEQDVEILMTSFSMNAGRLSDETREIEPKDIEYIQKLYYPYININIMFDQFFTGDENILLLVGSPGLGKSKMASLALKYAHENPDKLPYNKLEINAGLDSQFINCAYVKSIDVLVNDQFWRSLEARGMDFVIIDDLDYMLTKREAETASAEDTQKNIFLNQFLSFTDGVEKNKTKFIITSNQKYDDIDSALLRKGRLFDILELRCLTEKEALNIWISNKLQPNEYYNIFSGDNILAADLGSKISKRKNNRIGSATISYLKEKGISKVETAGKSKRINI